MHRNGPSIHQIEAIIGEKAQNCGLKLAVAGSGVALRTCETLVGDAGFAGDEVLALAAPVTRLEADFRFLQVDPASLEVLSRFERQRIYGAAFRACSAAGAISVGVFAIGTGSWGEGSVRDDAADSSRFAHFGD